MSGKVLQVKIVSIAGNKTVVGLHNFLRKHPIYEKYVKYQKKYMIHDEDNGCKVGDTVSIKETRPISRRKSWVVIGKEKSGE